MMVVGDGMMMICVDGTYKVELMYLKLEEEKVLVIIPRQKEKR